MASRKITHEKCAPLNPTPHEDAALGLFERRTYGTLRASAYCDYCGGELNKGDSVVALTIPRDAMPWWESDFMEVQG